MAHKIEQFDNIFSEDPRDKFIASAMSAQNALEIIPNPYVGNKRKILADLVIALHDKLDWDSITEVCDLFAGSSVVSAIFKMLGKKVTSNDLLRSSYLNGIALLNGSLDPISMLEWDFLTKNDNKNKLDFVEAKYSNIRFTVRESRFIDNFYANCVELYKTESIKQSIAHTSLIHFIMTYCFVGGRLNSGQVIAGLKHRLEHDRNQNMEMAFHKMRPFCFPMKGIDADCNHGDVSDFLARKRKFDLIYIDPPYGGQQSDYAFMYQFFEEYLTQTSFENIDYLQDKSKKFVKAKTYKDNFADLLRDLPVESKWVVSYNNSSWADINTISAMISQYKSNVEVKELTYAYKYRTVENSSGIEYVVIGQ